MGDYSVYETGYHWEEYQSWFRLPAAEFDSMFGVNKQAIEQDDDSSGDDDSSDDDNSSNEDDIDDN